MVPWKEKTVEAERAAFVLASQKREKSFSALCREYGISRPTGYKWLHRQAAGGGLSDRSRAPISRPRQIPEAMETVIVEHRQKEPALGAVKIHRILENEGYTNIPCPSTINAVLKRNGCISLEASRAATPYQRYEKEAPNMMWQADFKGHFQLGDGSRCHPLAIIDDHSRYCLNADAKPDERREGTKTSFQSTFQRFGLPEVLLCDNGNPWGTSQSTGYTLFEVWLMDLGILPIHIRPLHPQTQGKTERFNRSFKDERLRFYIPADMQDAQRQRLEYQEFYNHFRPHHALGLDVPAQHYQPSPRPFPDAIVPWEHDQGAVLAKVKSTGFVTYRGQGYFLSEAFAGHVLEIVPSHTDGVLNLVYRDFRIARIDLKERVVISKRCYRLVDDPRFTKLQNLS